MEERKIKNKGSRMQRYLYTFLSALLLLFSCSNGDNFITSKNIGNTSERIQTLRKYYKLKTEILDTEFEIFDVNLNADRSIPGPTDRDYKIVILVKSENIDTWTNGLTITSFPVNYDWAKDLLNGNNKFNFSGSPLLYKELYKELIVFKKEGIIFIRIKQ
ncbi:MAG: hypothetical protein P8107_12845 [Spirochaetia bacterium]